MFIKIKVKVKFSLCLTKHQAMETYWWVEVYIHAFFDLDTMWRWVVASRPDRFTPKERAPGTHWIGAWVGPRAGIEERNSQSPPGIEPRSSDRPARKSYLCPFCSQNVLMRLHYLSTPVCNYTSEIKNYRIFVFRILSG